MLPPGSELTPDFHLKPCGCLLRLSCSRKGSEPALKTASPKPMRSFNATASSEEHTDSREKFACLCPGGGEGTVPGGGVGRGLGTLAAIRLRPAPWIRPLMVHIRLNQGIEMLNDNGFIAQVSRETTYLSSGFLTKPGTGCLSARRFSRSRLTHPIELGSIFAPPPGTAARPWVGGSPRGAVRGTEIVARGKFLPSAFGA